MQSLKIINGVNFNMPAISIIFMLRPVRYTRRIWDYVFI